MPPPIVTRLAAIPARAACTDAERRAAVLVRDALRARGRPARLETAWVRPQWALLYAALCAAGVAGSLLAVAAPVGGLVVLAAALVAFAGDASGRLPFARVALPRRATECVVSEPAAASPDARVRLIVTAALDAGPTGAAYRAARLEAAARRALRGHLSSPPGLLTAALAALAGLAAARVAGAEGAWLGLAALAPTIALAVGAAAFLDIALAEPSPGAGAHASAVAVATALVAELDRRPPRHLAVELVLSGAGEAGQLGLRAYIAARRRAARPEQLAVLALGPCGAGHPRFSVTEGLLLPPRMHPGLVAVAEDVARTRPGLGAGPARRLVTGALHARLAGWPAIGVCCLDEHDRPGPARTAGDVPSAIDDEAVARALDLCRAFVARLDAELT